MSTAKVKLFRKTKSKNEPGCADVTFSLPAEALAQGKLDNLKWLLQRTDSDAPADAKPKIFRRREFTLTLPVGAYTMTLHAYRTGQPVAKYSEKLRVSPSASKAAAKPVAVHKTAAKKVPAKKAAKKKAA